jgi:hypothetical protein
VELDFALLADGVSHRPDGKLDIYGAGYDTILGPSVPVQHPRLMVALRVLISREEAGQRHEVDVILREVAGHGELARAHAEIASIPGADQAIPADRLAGIGMLLGFENVVFPEYGAYEFVIQWDSHDARHPIRLFVAERPSIASP